MNNAICARIKELRESRRLNQESLAKHLKVDPKTVYHWDAGDTTPSAANIIQLCKLFMVNADYLLCNTYNNALVLDNLSEPERIKIVAMFQAYINASKLSE